MLLTTGVRLGKERPRRAVARPWGAAALTVAAALAVLVLPMAALPLIAVQQTWGVLPVLTSLAWAAAAVRLLRRPETARTTGLAIMGIALASWFTATFGGLGVGLLLGLVAGALCVSRRPAPPS
ncbi:DUF6114 domain-containing protein [Streptomyces lavendofoliae]|uniref:DUF6114 domain-containing protein n=1 Tax=Streptomyces lavendofoliae TaxID=67314 RepID=UPI00300E99F3